MVVRTLFANAGDAPSWLGETRTTMQGPENAKPLFDAGDWIALGAAVVALVAMSIAIWQAYEARKSRKATRDQAGTAKKALDETKKQSAASEKSAAAAMLSLGSAERAAGAAEEQAVHARHAVQAAMDQVSEARAAAQAAVDQVEIMRQALNAENVERHERSGPEFSVVEGKGKRNSRTVTVTMLSGPAVVRVTPSWTADSSVPQTDGEDVGGIQAGEYEAQRVVRNTSFDIEVGKGPTGRTPIVIEVYLHCVDDHDNTRVWDRVHSVTLAPPVRVSTVRYS
ncbi:hypothetical protein [Lentzea sp. NPDC059081]|uniref:hypothetical protein n=1 Tax=Lentzea sp. NPDC059081 TaxID=3346719 RepID=UPI00368ED3D0